MRVVLFRDDAAQFDKGDAVTVGMRVRMWASQAPRGEVLTTVAVALALLIGLVIVAVPGDRTDELVGATPLPPALASALPDAADGAPAAPLPDGQAGAPGGSGAVAGAASGAAGGSPVPSGSAGGVAAPPASGGETGDTPAPQALTASDQGVTEETLKVGFLNVQIGGFDATGFALGFRDDLDDVQKALVDDANRQGGVHGRRITYASAKADPLSQSSMRAGCIKMTDDEKVFVVFDQTATSGTALRCFAEKRTPNFTTNAGTVDAPFWAAAGGYLISGGAVMERQVLNWASMELASGVIGPGKGKLGILSDDCYPSPEVVDKVLKPFLREHGVDFADERVSCDTGSAQQQVGAAALRLRGEGVNRVFLLALFTSAQSFVQQAESQGWVPAYSVTDAKGLSLDVTTQGFSPTAFNGARGTTYGHSGASRRGVPLSPGLKRCDEIIRAAGLPGITNPMGKDGLAVATCDHFFTWIAAMSHTPVNPTRADVVRGVSQIGVLELAAYALRASYGPDKYQGADAWATIEWSGDCRCWTQTGDPQPAAF